MSLARTGWEAPIRCVVRPQSAGHGGGQGAGRGPVIAEPMMILVTWSSVRYVSVLMEELEKDHPRD